VFLTIRREKTTIFLDATEETTVVQLKRILQGIVKKVPEDLRLYNTTNKEELDDNKTLGDCGYKAHTAKAQDPGSIGLAYRICKFGKELTVQLTQHGQISPKC
jgi:transcription elongation factor B subunit 2